jgi:hypothetical protein
MFYVHDFSGVGFVFLFQPLVVTVIICSYCVINSWIHTVIIWQIMT